MDDCERPLRIKTCLSSFERYCEENSRCQTQMKKLRQCLNTTMTRYSKMKSSNKNKEESTPDNKRNNMSSKKWGNSRKKRLMLQFNPEIIEVTKLKLHPSQSYNPTKMKTEYTVPRNNFKNYIKVRDNEGSKNFNSYKTHLCRSEEPRNANKTQKGHYANYRYRDQCLQKEEMKEIVVDLKYKRSKTNPNLNNSDLKTYMTSSQEKKRCKVVYSSKGDLNQSARDKNLEKIQIKVKVPKKNTKEHLTGWQTPYLDDQLSFDSHELLKKHKGLIFR